MIFLLTQSLARDNTINISFFISECAFNIGSYEVRNNFSLSFEEHHDIGQNTSAKLINIKIKYTSDPILLLNIILLANSKEPIEE